MKVISTNGIGIHPFSDTNSHPQTLFVAYKCYGVHLQRKHVTSWLWFTETKQTRFKKRMLFNKIRQYNI